VVTAECLSLPRASRPTSSSTACGAQCRAQLVVEHKLQPGNLLCTYDRSVPFEICPVALGAAWCSSRAPLWRTRRTSVCGDWSTVRRAAGNVSSRRPLRGTNANVAAKGLLSELKSSLRSLRLSRQASPRRLWPLQRIETAKWPALFYTRLRVRRVATAASHAPGSRALSPMEENISLLAAVANKQGGRVPAAHCSVSLSLCFP